MTVHNKSYKFRFYPSAQQRQQLAIDFGCARFVWNASLDARSFAYRVLGQSVSGVDCSRAITELKRDPDYAWLLEANSTVLTQALRDQDTAFKNFFDGRAAYPQFKKKHHAQSVRYQLDQRQIQCTFDATSGLLKLPKLGRLKLRWSQRPAGVPKMVTVSLDAVGRYFVSFACEVEIQPLPTTTKSVGVDLGLASLMTTSEGAKEAAPRLLRRYARKLKLAQRTLARRVKGSGRWHRARQRVAKIQAKIAAIRRDFLHQLSTRLVRTYGLIALEDLNVKALCRALRLGKSMADAALGELVRQIEYKARWYGRQVIKIDRFARSTGVCPDCGAVGPKRSLKVRQWRCACGAEHDRDVAAARVILQIATAGSGGVSAWRDTPPKVLTA
jgi:putative transposase